MTPTDQPGPDDGPPFTVAIERNGDVGLMRLAGELDFAQHQSVIDLLHTPEAAGITQWAIDCSDLTFVDSGGLRAILAVAGSVGGLSGIALYEPRAQFVSLLDAAGLLDSITIRPAEEPTS